MLSAAQRQAASLGAHASTVSSMSVEAPQCSEPMPANCAGSWRAEDADDDSRFAKRARKAEQSQDGQDIRVVPPQHRSIRASGQDQSAAALSGSEAVDSCNVAASVPLPTLAAEQVDGSTCVKEEEAGPGWPPDMHDTVGCVTVNACGAVLTSASSHNSGRGYAAVHHHDRIPYQPSSSQAIRPWPASLRQPNLVSSRNFQECCSVRASPSLQ